MNEIRAAVPASKNTVKTPPLLKKVTGVILAGGKSTRYGRNKAFAEIQGIPLIERVTTVMGSVFQRLVISTNSPQEYAYLGLPMAEDIIKGIGPLGGIYTCLNMIPDDAGFFVACDMPFLNASLLRLMVEAWEDCDAVVPRLGRMYEPLHALYAKTCLVSLREGIDFRRYQIVESFHRLRIRYVDEDVIRAVDPDLKCLSNVNRPGDLSGIETERG
ncbi:MAG: molybdenum cofactor guanylyltransferase [Deltaproteobacteria bacterium]|nr:molybdenum cofactor guanylyltransferase [Deltaproteobacteria bacterium]